MQNQKRDSVGTASADSEIRLNTIEEAIEEIKKGKVIIVVDDEDRENEGDFICAASCITPEIINFMATHGRGLICTPIEEQRGRELGLEMMVRRNTALHETAFTVSIDLVGHGCSTGISAYDRSRGIRAIVDFDTKPNDFAKPGHIFPLIAKDGGVLRRTGHTEAAIDLARLAGHAPAGVLVEILNEDGTMARLPQLIKLADKLDLKIISIKDLVAFRLKNERLVHEVSRHALMGKLSDFELTVFGDTSTGQHHMAITHGKWTDDDAVLVRVYSAPDQDLVMGLLTGTYGERYDRIINAIKKEGKGVFLLIRKDVEENDFPRQLNNFLAQKIDDKAAKASDGVQRDIGVGAQILATLNIKKIRVMTNTPRRSIGLEGYGIEMVDFVGF
jgi:3,4-dihydroxy 2-butanone 4-phosphate synthase/GTP cyclohydrolase II